MSVRTRLIVMFSITGLTGISAIFLPFSGSVSPMEAVRYGFGGFLDGIWKLGSPFFLSVLILGASLHSIISGTLSKVERWIAYILSISIVCITLSFFISSSPSDFSKWIILLATILPLAFGLFLVNRSLKIEKLKMFSPIMAMQTAYLGNCVFCLIGFYDDLEIGAYCALVTAVLYVVHMIMISLNRCSMDSQ